MSFVYPSQTANSLYPYSKVYNVFDEKHTLEELVDQCHKDLSEASGWDYKALSKGSFGYDNMACSIGYVMSNFENIIKHMETNKNEETIEYMADLVHQGWIMNYTYWRDNSPWEKNKVYRAPYKPLGDDKRDKQAVTKYEDLPSFEKQSDKVIAGALFQMIAEAYLKFVEKNSVEASVEEEPVHEM